MSIDTEAPPISPSIVGQHIDAASAALAMQNADGLLLFRETNILAFAGVPLGPSDRLICALLSRDGGIAFIVPAFEAEMAGGLPPGGRLVPWEEHEDPYAAVARGAAELGIERGRILLDGYTWLDAHRRLKAALPKATLDPDHGLIERIRIVKSDEEIDAIRAGCEDTGKIFPLVRDRLRPGVCESELAAELLTKLRAAGVQPVGELFQGGPSASVPHKPTGRRTFCDGEAVIVDFWCRHEGYFGDMTRTFALGRPDDEVRRAYRLVRDAQRAAIARIRPGAPCEEIDRTARSLIEAGGLGKYFCHRLGHGIGLDIHEPPYLVGGNTLRLEPGMCVTVEPGVYVPGRFGIRIEDVVVVTAEGCEVLSGSIRTDFSNFE